MDCKYRVDFYYWNCETGFSHIKTNSYRDTFIEAEEYVSYINKDYLNKLPYDGIWVKIVDNENDYVVSEFWWKSEK